MLYIGGDNLKEYKITDARTKLYGIVSDVNVAYNPVKIVNTKGDNAVILSEKDWNSIQETLYLQSIPGYVESIKKADEETDWDNALEYNPNKPWDKW